MRIPEAIRRVGDQPLTGASQLPAKFQDSLISFMGDLFSSATADELHELESLLSKTCESLARATSQATTTKLSDIVGSDGYVLGQLSFAQQFVADTASKRIGSESLSQLKDRRWSPYLRILLAGDRTNSEIQREVGEAPETVSRKLRLLRQLGITDFRKEGVNVANFLSPSVAPLARQLYSATSPEAAFASECPPSVETVVSARLDELLRDTPPELRSMMWIGHANSATASANE